MDRFPKEQDRHRDREIYRYLFSLAVVYRGEPGKLDDPKNINFNKTAARFGEKADYARRIYNFITNNDHDGYNLPSKITTAELVGKLSTLLENLDPGTIQQEDISKLFGYLVSLTPQERKALNCSKSETDTLIQQALINIGYYRTDKKQNANDQSSPYHFLRASFLPSNILNLYKSAIGLDAEFSSDHKFNNINEVYRLIEEVVNNRLGNIGVITTEKIKQTYVDKVKRRLERIIAQSGFTQIIGFALTSSNELKSNIFSSYFSPQFVKTLTLTTIENEQIRQKIPLYLEFFDIKRIETLPLYLDSPRQEQNLLNADLFFDNQEEFHDAGLTSLYTYSITVWFRLGIENEDQLKNSQDIPHEVKSKLFKSNKKGIVFKVTSSGVGTQLSQIIKIINRALFWDVECIGEEYFAIAHDLIHEIAGNQIGSPVWSHSLVRLCRLDTLQQALRHTGKYSDYAHIEEVARGDYLGFSLLEASAKSALQARLAAILQTNIHPERYKKDLTETIIHREILRISEEFLDYYPFSLSAMEGYLQRYQYLKGDVLNSNSETDVNPGNQQVENPSRFSYDAYLTIIKGYLREGLYRKAKIYFDSISNLEEISEKNLNNFRPDINRRFTEDCEIFSGASLAKYEILKAYYLYLFDDADKEKTYQWPSIDDQSKTHLISKAWDCLDNATNHLKIRIAKYAAINEISQAIFHPYFVTLAHINFRKAKLFLYFPNDSANRFAATPELKHPHYARLHFFEKARIYAAKHGNKETYAIYTALQVWAYIIAAYLVDKSVSFPSGKSVDLTRKTCLNFAKSLRDNALISYTEYGQKCYYQIKEKSGIYLSAKSKLSSYGPVKIDPIPLIAEERSDGEIVNQGYGCFTVSPNGSRSYKNDNILHIDMALLHMKTLDNSDEVLEESIYLFGTKAANLLFARGMYELCGDENTDTINAWQTKILKAYRLFTYAWAIAEDGGKTESKSKDECRIIRPDFTEKVMIEAQVSHYPPPEALSVRDIYPHRQSEMSDMGKVFAIASRLLLMHLTKNSNPLAVKKSQQQLEQYESEIHQLIAHFHSTKRCNPELIEQQKYFNGHLRSYLSQIKEISNQELKNIHNNTYNYSYPLNCKEIPEIRDRLIKEFFSALQKRH